MAVCLWYEKPWDIYYRGICFVRLLPAVLARHAELDLRPASFTVLSTWQLELTKQMRERKDQPHQPHSLWAQPPAVMDEDPRVGRLGKPPRVNLPAME